MLRRYSTLFILFLISTSIYAQNAATVEKQKERYEEKVEEDKQNYISELLKTLEVDDFQKEIIKQTMDSYFNEVVKMQGLGLKSYEFKDELVKLRERHFADVKAIVSEETMNKIDDALTGEWKPKDEKKKRKKRKRNRNKDN